jgi:hypothetical protein
MATGWLLVVGGVLAARRSLPARLCVASIVGGSVSLLVGAWLDPGWLRALR